MRRVSPTLYPPKENSPFLLILPAFTFLLSLYLGPRNNPSFLLPYLSIPAGAVVLFFVLLEQKNKKEQRLNSEIEDLQGRINILYDQLQIEETKNKALHLKLKKYDNLALLTEKFNLFSGVFGASDDVLGSIESGVDFEKRILAIYQQCRTPAEIEAAFKLLQAELDERIQARMNDTRKLLLENFDEEVHERLRVRLTAVKAQLDRFSKRFWSLTRFILKDRAQLDDAALVFYLSKPPVKDIAAGCYHLISKATPGADNPQISETAEGLQAEYGTFLYRLSHPLGEFVIDHAKHLETPAAHILFNVSQHPARLHTVEKLRGRQGYLALNTLAIESYEREEYLLFSALDDQGQPLDQETCEKLFHCDGEISGQTDIPDMIAERLTAESQRHIKAAISRSLEGNNKYFHEAREKLEKWADDLVLAAEKALKDTKEQIKFCQRQARLATNLDEQHEIQLKIQKLEKQQRRQRQEIFQVEDSIIDKRDALIASLERRLSQKTESSRLFTIAWSVV